MIHLHGDPLTGKKESDKKEIEAYLLLEGPISNLPVLDSKVFR